MGLPHALGELVRLDEHGRGARVREDPRDLVRGGGVVDRHGNGTEPPQGEVHERPLVAGAAQQTHTVPGADALGGHPAGEGHHLGAELTSGDVPLPPRGEDRVEHQIRLRAGTLLEDVSDAGVGQGIDDGRGTDASHGGTFLARLSLSLRCVHLHTAALVDVSTQAGSNRVALPAVGTGVTGPHRRRPRGSPPAGHQTRGTARPRSRRDPRPRPRRAADRAAR